MAIQKIKTKIVALGLPGSDHDARGIGFYTRRLISELKIVAKNHDIQILEFTNEPPGNAHLTHYLYFDLFRRTLHITKEKTTVTVFDTTPLQFPNRYPPGLRGRLNFFHQKKELKKASAIITISHFSKEMISRYLNIPPSKIHVTHLAPGNEFKPISDAKVLSRVKSKFRLPSKFVLYVGDINWNKNLNRLTEGCLRVKLPLVIVGKNALNPHLNLNHPELLHFKSWLEKYSDHPLVRRLGFVDTPDLVALYNLARVHCQPALSEGFGLTILEAMACGTPVACSNTTSLPEVAGDAALYFNPTDTEEISSVLKKIVTSKLISARLKNKGFEQARKFNWAQTARDTIKVYNSQL